MSCTHPHRAYYYGDKTPKGDPELYIRTIRNVYTHFQKELRVKDPRIPLVINTSGWLNGTVVQSIVSVAMVTNYALFLPLCADMGVQLFLDTVRTLKPTHIIRCLPQFRQSVDYVRTLPPLTAEYMSTTPGLFTWPERSPPHPSGRITEPGYIPGEPSTA